MSETPWLWQCERSIPSSSAAGRVVQEELVEQLVRYRWPEHDVFSVRLAFEEAIANAVKHGNRMDPAKQIHITCRLGPSQLYLEVADEGDGFDPTAVPDPTAPDRLEEPSGRGIMLMRSFMDRVEFGPCGNCVKLEKRVNSLGTHECPPPIP
jgi:serine/threonine-protein kinase RsbW